MEIIAIVKKDCHFCDSLKKQLEKEGIKDKVRFIKIESDESQRILTDIGVLAVPVVVIKEDGKIIKSYIGFENKYVKSIKKYINQEKCNADYGLF